MDKNWRRQAGQEFIDFLIAQEKKRTMQLLEYNPDFKPSKEEMDEYEWLQSKWKVSDK